jgi:OFA family oxalate/formate antiporter-like MFS transporter
VSGARRSRTNPSRESDGQTLAYSWLVVAACFGLTLTLGETFWTFGVFFKPLQQEFGWSRALVSSIFTAFLLGYAVSVIASGRLVDRYNPKPVLFISALLIGSGLCLCSVASTITDFRFFLLIVGLGSGATWSVPSSTVQRWFYKKRSSGLALGVVVSGVGVGALVFAPLINFLIMSHGWRHTFLIIGMVFFAVVIAATLVIRPSPSDTMTTLKDRGSVPNEVTWPATNQLLSTWAFAAITFLVSAGVIVFQIISAHLVPHATDAGISASASAAALGLMGGFSIPGRILSGLFSARLGWYKMLALSFFGAAISIVWLLVLKDIWMLYVFASSYGVFHGIRIAAQIGVLQEIFGIRSLGELIGISSAVAQVVGAFAPYAAGAIFDATGSYSQTFQVILVLSVAAGLVAALLKRIAARCIAPLP